MSPRHNDLIPLQSAELRSNAKPTEGVQGGLTPPFPRRRYRGRRDLGPGRRHSRDGAHRGRGVDRHGFGYPRRRIRRFHGAGGPACLRWIRRRAGHGHHETAGARRPISTTRASLSGSWSCCATTRPSAIPTTTEARRPESSLSPLPRWPNGSNRGWARSSDTPPAHHPSADIIACRARDPYYVMVMDWTLPQWLCGNDSGE